MLHSMQSISHLAPERAVERFFVAKPIAIWYTGIKTDSMTS